MENQKSTEFTKKLLALAVPAAFQQFMLALVSASDAFMLGALAQDALSAVSLAGQIAFVENLFLAAMTIGLSMFAAQYIGKEDYDSTGHIFAYVMKITVLISAVFFLAGLCMPKIKARFSCAFATFGKISPCYDIIFGNGMIVP